MRRFSAFLVLFLANVAVTADGGVPVTGVAGPFGKVAVTAIAGILGVWLLPVTASAEVCRIPREVLARTPDKPPGPPPSYETIRDQDVAFADIQLGIGHLHPLPDATEWDWIHRLELPLSRGPGAEPAAWLAGGWVIAGTGAPVPLTTAGLIETGYEVATLLVLESRPDGWLRIRYRRGGDGDGTAWVPRCALSEGPLRLAFTPWCTWFLSDQISPLFFRSKTPHVLRAGPHSTATRIALISGDDHLEPMEVHGDWMRVTVKQPSDYCRPDAQASQVQGWMRWFSWEKGPWVWYHTRGC